MSEQDLQNAILDWLHIHRAWAIRVNSGFMKIEDAKGRTRVFKGAPAGTPDIIGIWPGGLGFAIECKLKGNKPTPKQAETLESIQTAGGLTIVAYSLDDVIHAFRERGCDVN